MSRKKQKGGKPNSWDTLDWSPDNWFESYETAVKDIRVNTEYMSQSDRGDYHKVFWRNMEAVKNEFAERGADLKEMAAHVFIMTFLRFTIIEATDKRSVNGSFVVYLKEYRNKEMFESWKHYRGVCSGILIVPWEDWGFTKDIFEYAIKEVSSAYERPGLSEHQMDIIDSYFNIHRGVNVEGSEEINSFEYPKIKGRIDHFGVAIARLILDGHIRLTELHGGDTPLFRRSHRRMLFFKTWDEEILSCYKLTSQEVKSFKKWLEWEMENGILERIPKNY